MVRTPVARPAAPPSDAAIAAKAAIRAADRLALSARTLAQVIGVSDATVSRLKGGAAELDPQGKPFELALLFVRLYRALDAITGGDDAVARAWVRAPNLALGAAPIDRIVTVTGLLDVVGYLDARRAQV
ncbi:MAG: MbcA/ParS/Xre antitoxin family protein [Hyphomicrobiales bacterium]